MKTLKVVFSVILCLVMLASCSTTDNTDYFRQHIEQTNSQIPDNMRYLPALLASYENTDDIRFTVMDNTVAYSLDKSVEGKSGYTYSSLNAHVRVHNDNVATIIGALSMSFGDDDITKAVKHEYKDVTYAITYEIRPDTNVTSLNVIYPLSEFVSAYFTVTIDGTENMDEKTLDKICKDLEMIKL